MGERERDREREREEKTEIVSMSNALIFVTLKINRRGFRYRRIINRKSGGDSRARKMT